MNRKYDQIEKLILFYSHNSLFLVPVSGQYVMGISVSSPSGLHQAFCCIIGLLEMAFVVISKAYYCSRRIDSGTMSK